MPPRRWVAHASGRVSSCRRQRVANHTLMRCTYSIHREDSNDLVPLCALIWLESKLLCEPTCQPVHALFDLQARVCLAGKTASEGIMRVAKRMPAKSLIQHKIAYWDRVRRVEWELRNP